MPTAPGFANVAIQLTHSGMSRPAYLTFGVDPTSTDPQLIATSVSGACAAAGSLMSMLDNETTLTEVRTSLGTDGGEDLVGGISTSVSGGAALTSLPPNCAVLIHKRTSRGGRRGRGRFFLPWAIGEGNVDEAGLVASLQMTSIQTAMTTWLGALSTANVPMVLLHDPGRTSPGPPNLVTALTVDKMISTQRRRLGR